MRSVVMPRSRPGWRQRPLSLSGKGGYNSRGFWRVSRSQRTKRGDLVVLLSVVFLVGKEVQIIVQTKGKARSKWASLRLDVVLRQVGAL